MKTQHTRILGLSLLWIWCLLISPLAYGQLTKTREESDREQTIPQQFEFQKPIDAEDEKTVATLRKILLSRRDIQEQLDRKLEKLDVAATEDEKEAIRHDIQELHIRLDDQESDFESIATGIDLEHFTAKASTTFDWKQDLQEMLSPIIQELTNITARPREVEKLRQEIAYYEKRLPIIEDALANLQKSIDAATAQLIERQLSELKNIWQDRHEEFASQLVATRYQLQEKLETQRSFIESAGSIFKEFFKSRGLHFMLAVLAFMTVFLVMRLLYRFVYKAAHLNTPGKHSFFIRLISVIYHLLTFLWATIALMVVLYVAGDWVLLGLTLIFLIGIVWTSKQAFSTFWEQIKLFLNLSTVREGERIIFRGLPWKIESLNLYTRLHNPALKGGLLRLPLRELVGLQSRPFHKDEPWFPCQEGDMVQLADGSAGTILMQTPEQVIFDTRGGTRKTYPTITFLQQNPINLSLNNFGVFITFGIDYAHQAIVTRDVPQKLQEMLAEELAKEEYGEHLETLDVQFKEAGTSSLDLLIITVFSGKAAANYFAIPRALQRMTVEACNTYGWGIPFPQVTVHHGDL
ncbi:MAG: mechanosensitive ion channel [bacterium]|nr:mechanosensitive ion channel [bacterium]